MFLVRLLNGTERIAAWLASVTMLVIMCIVVSDVIMRYAFRMPWPWAYDMITIYLMVTLFYLAIPMAHTQRANIAVDLLVHMFKRRMRHAVEFLTSAIALLVFSMIGWTIYGNLIKEIFSNEVVQGYYDFPTFIASLLIVIGSVLVCMRSLIQLSLHAASMLSERDYCQLPILPGEE